MDSLLMQLAMAAMSQFGGGMSAHVRPHARRHADANASANEAHGSLQQPGNGLQWLAPVDAGHHVGLHDMPLAQRPD